jgi:SAM-dependent methyltransferase
MRGISVMNEREAFYQKIVSEQIKDRDASILVCGAGSLDKQIFANLGFSDVTLSNLDEKMDHGEYAPFKWKYENAEILSFNNSVFDYVVIHAAIHHASSPHKVLTEMYRVAKKGVLAFESRDSVIMRFLERNGLTQVYEYTAVYYNDCKYGGMNNTEIPNFVYRWTEREIEKTIQAYAPYFKHKFIYRYGTAFPCTPGLEAKGVNKTIFLKLMRPFYWLFAKIFVKQQNLFAFYIEKPIIQNSLLPWLIFDESERKIKFNKKWGDQKYRSSIK